MKFYIGAICLVGSMMTMGCAELMPGAAGPAGSAALSSAQLPAPAPMLDENPYLVTEKPAKPMVAEDPWGPEAASKPATQTWGASLSMAVDYGF